MVGAPGAEGGLLAPAVRRGMVGAGAGAFGAGGAPGAGALAVGGLGVVGVGGAATVGGLGGPPGTGGLATGGAPEAGSVAEGADGGESAAFKVTRTVSFFKGTLEVCLEGVLLSLSLMRSGF